MWGCERAVIIWMITLPMEGCDRPKSLLLHCCIIPLAKYLGVVITFISGFTALLHWVGDVMRLQPQTSSLDDLICSISLTQCHSAFGEDFSYAPFCLSITFCSGYETRKHRKSPFNESFLLMQKFPPNFKEKFTENFIISWIFLLQTALHNPFYPHL